MTQIQEHVDLQAILQTAIAPAAGFGTQLFLSDDSQIPIDIMYKTTTKRAYADDYDVSSTIYDYCVSHFSQKRVPSLLMLGRFLASASSPYYTMPDYNSDYTDWELITDGAIKFVSGANNVTVSSLDFDGCTSFAQVITILNAGLAALAAPTIVGLDSAEFSIDSNDRLIITMPDTGDSAVKIDSIESPAAGTDLTGSDYLNIGTNDKSVSGYDAESPVEAVQRIKQYTNSFYNIQERGCDAAQQLLLAQYVETQENLLDIVSTSSDAYDPTKTTDIGYLIKALSLKRTLPIYTDDSTEYPDSANAGCVFPADEGTTSFAYEVMTQVTASMKSGGLIELGSTEKTALKDKNYNYIETVGSNTYMYNGITSGNEEKRIMLGRDWFVSRIREAIFTSMLNEPLHAFDADTFAIVESAIRAVGDVAITRKIIVDTVERPFTVEMPDPDDITAAERASRTFDKEDIFTAYLNSAINDYVIVGTWSI